VTAADLSNHFSSSATDTRTFRPRLTTRSSASTCSSKKSRLTPIAAAASAGLSASLGVVTPALVRLPTARLGVGGSEHPFGARELIAAVAASAHASTWHDTKAGLTINYPSGWHVTKGNVTTITEPVPRLVIYTGAPPRPVMVAGPRAGQVVAILMEQTPVSASELLRFPRRPARFQVKHLGAIESFAGDHWAELTFRDTGRAFYIFVGVGAKALAQLPKALDALDSLRVAP
jgi:hypothetical protein